MQTAGDRLRQLREAAGFATPTEAANAFGFNSVTYLAHERADRGIKPSVAEKYARAFKSTAAYILTGTHQKRRRQIPLVGHVGAGAEALLYSAGQGPFDEVDAPDGSTDATVAVEVRGESLGALFDRWLVFYDDVRDPPGHREIGELCVVGLTDGRVLVKKLVRGQLPGMFTLLSNVEPPIYDVAVEWAARVTTMQPR